MTGRIISSPLSLTFPTTRSRSLATQEACMFKKSVPPRIMYPSIILIATWNYISSQTKKKNSGVEIWMNTNYMLITNGNDIWKGQVKNSWSKQALKEEKPVWIHQNCFNGFIKPIPILSNKLTPTNTPSTHPKKKKNPVKLEISLYTFTTTTPFLHKHTHKLNITSFWGLVWEGFNPSDLLLHCKKSNQQCYPLTHKKENWNQVHIIGGCNRKISHSNMSSQRYQMKEEPFLITFPVNKF